MITHQRHFACAVIFRKTRNGLEALVFESVTTDPRTGRPGKVKIKFPGGMKKDSSEMPLETMMREVSEETGLRVNGARQVYGQPSPSNRTIIQYAYVAEIDDCTGILHTKAITDGNTKISRPTWVDIRVILRGGLILNHHRMFLAALRDFRRC